MLLEDRKQMVKQKVQPNLEGPGSEIKKKMSLLVSLENMATHRIRVSQPLQNFLPLADTLDV